MARVDLLGSWITNPDPDQPKGMHPKTQAMIKLLNKTIKNKFCRTFYHCKL